MSEDKERDAGWAWPLNSRKAHYFNDCRSLCGKMLFFGKTEQGNDNSPDNCAACKKKLLKENPPTPTVKG